MSMEIQFLYEETNTGRHRASFTQEDEAERYRREQIENHPHRELLVETHDYRRGDVQ